MPCSSACPLNVGARSQPAARLNVSEDLVLGTLCCSGSAQALAAVAADDPGRLAVHEAGGVPLLIKLMDDGSPDLVSTAMRGQAVSDTHSLWWPHARFRSVASMHGDQHIAPAEKNAPHGWQLSTRFATELVGQLAHAETLKTAIRDAGGLLALVRHLKVRSCCSITHSQVHLLKVDIKCEAASTQT